MRLNQRMTTLAVVGLLTVPAAADDWPGWMGPQRDGVLRESGLVESIPETGLPVLWRTPIAGGYAGPAVADDRVYVFDYQRTSGKAFNDPGTRATLQGDERLTALEAKTGKPIWQASYPCPYSVSYPAGPRCTPTVDGDRVYTLGSEGDLHAYETQTGERVWAVSFKQDLSADVPIWGFAAHPLVVRDLLITMVGGEGQCVVAFDKTTGEVVWKALDGPAGYCPPSIIDFGGTEQLIVYSPGGVDSLNPADGSRYWHIDLSPMYEMSITRPVVDGNLMYASGIRTQSVMIELDETRPAAKELWRGEDRRDLFCANSTPLFVDGIVYGTDCNAGSLMAIDGEKGGQLWATFEPTVPGEKRFVKHGTAFITRISDTDRYLLFGETGLLTMARMTAGGFESLGAMQVLQPTGEAFGRSVVWSHPAYSDAVAYIRNDEEIVAVDLRGN